MMIVLRAALSERPASSSPQVPVLRRWSAEVRRGLRPLFFFQGIYGVLVGRFGSIWSGWECLGEGVFRMECFLSAGLRAQMTGRREVA